MPVYLGTTKCKFRLGDILATEMYLTPSINILPDNLLLSSDNIILMDKDGYYLIPKEGTTNE